MKLPKTSTHEASTDSRPWYSPLLWQNPPKHTLFRPPQADYGGVGRPWFSAKADRNHETGTSLIEILIVIGIFGLIISLGLVTSFNSYRRSNLRAERDILVSVLAKARNQSISNVNESPHGISVQPGNYVIFQGSSYATRDTSVDEDVPYVSSLTVSGTNEIVFVQLTGEVTTPGTITISFQSNPADISVNSEGRIDW